MTIDSDQRTRLTTRRQELTAQYLAPRAERPATTARGVHHVALISSDVERTVQFFQGVLGFPLIEMFENRDYEGSTHFFFDIGNGNTLAYFDLPGLDLGAYQEVLGGHHHLAISVERSTWERLKDRLEQEHIETAVIDDSSLYFSGPDGERLELISDPLLEMYGNHVG
jgi:catechol 2,3-dioxygenase-like lactoylglutathione lyase family enzyme